MLARLVKKQNLIIVFTLIVAYFPLAHHIEKQTIRLWDEGHNATNALEMHYNYQ